MRRGFTLIELLVVVAVIAILAAIALPNFLQAQTRAKISRVKADLRTIATAVEMYRVDCNAYPETLVTTRWQRFYVLTTPIAYLTTEPRDPFCVSDDSASDSWGARHFVYKFGATPVSMAFQWALSSNGPDLDEMESIPIKEYPGFSWTTFTGATPGFSYLIYDPTNGVISNGDVRRVSDYALP